MVLLESIGLTKEYEDQAVVKDISIRIEATGALAFIGPTGSGKTTLIRMLDLLEVPTSGTIHFDGLDATHNHRTRLEARRRMAYVQQRPLVLSMSVADNVACGLKWRREKSHTVKQAVDGALELVGMQDYRKRNARTLSGGETQRIAIARALVTKPEILFLDEPTANLDPISTSKVEEVICDVIREKKAAVVMATHDMVQGQQMASRVGVLLKGKLMQLGSPTEIFHSPESHTVAEFVGIENMLSGRVSDNEGDMLKVSVDGTRIEAVPDKIASGDVYVLVRPEDITLSLASNVTSARNVFRGTVAGLTPVGPLMRVEMDCGFRLLALVTRNSAEDLQLEEGKEVWASFKATATHVIARRL